MAINRDNGQGTAIRFMSRILIRRSAVMAGLAFAGSGLLAACDAPPPETSNGIFLRTVEDCRYLPSAISAKRKSCEAFFAASRTLHRNSAPRYPSPTVCREEGVTCEAIVIGGKTLYSPKFAGTYYFPDQPHSQKVVYGGNSYFIAAPRPVYLGFNPIEVVTPYGETLRPQSVRSFQPVPRSVEVAPPPSRPQGVQARGYISGRGTGGFGSTYKGTAVGRGGK